MEQPVAVLSMNEVLKTTPVRNEFMAIQSFKRRNKSQAKKEAGKHSAAAGFGKPRRQDLTRSIKTKWRGE